MGPLLADDGLPPTLSDLLSNSLVLRQTAPYLPISSIYALAATSKTLYHVVHHSPEIFRYLDLSSVKSAIVPYEPLDSGGISWRAERMDESLTEDEFYSGPLRGIFSKLERRQVLYNVHTLVLDGLSVPADLVREVIAEDRFNVRILSIREVKHLNERKLQQVLRYAVRPSRPAGTPKIKGIYFFGPREHAPIQDAPGKKKPPPTAPTGVLSSEGAQIGAEWNQRSSEALSAALARTEDKWYQCSGRMMAKRPSLEWAETLKACEGIIAFDAVLCRGPRHDPTKAFVSDPASPSLPNPASYLNPAIATVALGPNGCETCNSCPERPAVFGHSLAAELPLLSPIPLHSSTIRAAQMPHSIGGPGPLPLFVRCEDCLKGRWCERCHKWWDEDCYAGSTIAQRTELQQTEFIEDAQGGGAPKIVPKQTIKVVMGCGDEELFSARTGYNFTMRRLRGSWIPDSSLHDWPRSLTIGYHHLDTWPGAPRSSASDATASAAAIRASLAKNSSYGDVQHAGTNTVLRIMMHHQLPGVIGATLPPAGQLRCTSAGAMRSIKKSASAESKSLCR